MQERQVWHYRPCGPKAPLATASPKMPSDRRSRSHGNPSRKTQDSGTPAAERARSHGRAVTWVRVGTPGSGIRFTAAAAVALPGAPGRRLGLQVRH